MPTPPRHAATRAASDPVLHDPVPAHHAAASAFPGPAAPDAEAVTALGWLLHAALPPLRLERLAVHDALGEALWWSAGVLMPADRAAAQAALAAFHADGSLAHHERALEDGRTALALPLRDDAGAVAGTVVFLADRKAVHAREPARLLTAPLVEILGRLAQAVCAPPAPGAAELPGTSVDRLLSASAPAPADSTRPGDAGTTSALRLQPLTRLGSGGRTHRYEIVLPGPGDGPDGPQALPTPAREASGAALRATVDPRVAVAELVAWLQRHPTAWQSEPASFCLPLGARALEDERFPAFVGDALARSGVDAECLGFRLPERLVRQRHADARRFVGACERLGTFVVVDRFTLEAGLPRLLESRAVRGVALDPQLGNAVARDRMARALVAALVQAARVLGLHCIAERVEADAARQWLAGIGVDFHRGGAAGPLTLAELAAAIARNPGARTPVPVPSTPLDPGTPR